VSGAGLGRSFRDAFCGLLVAAAQQRNVRIHITAAWIVLGLCAVTGVERWEWAAVVIVSGVVVAAEMLNTAIERTLDVATPTFHPAARDAKRTAAAAVLVLAAAAVGVGAVVFVPRAAQVPGLVAARIAAGNAFAVVWLVVSVGGLLWSLMGPSGGGGGDALEDS